MQLDIQENILAMNYDIVVGVIAEPKLANYKFTVLHSIVTELY
jgi:hypothetical protein